MSEPREDQEGPTGTDASPLETEGPWRNVPRPTTEELVTPSTQVVDPPAIPRGVKVIGVVIVVVLLVLSVWLGLSLGRSGPPAPPPSPTVEEPLWELEPPTTVGDFVRGDVTSTPQGNTSDRDIVRADYTDGTDSLILLLSRPEDDFATYFEGAGVSEVEPVEDADNTRCGISTISTDSDIPFCARIVDETAIAVAGLSEQSPAELTSLVDSFYEQLQ